MKIVFFGTSSFAAAVLRQLMVSSHTILAIVTRPDRVQGRSLRSSAPPVKLCAAEVCPHIPLLQPEKASAPEFVAELAPFGADLFVVVAYGEILKEALLALPPRGCINIHASLLPAWRGASPLQRALMAGDKETGVTLISMVREMDAGDMLAQEKMTIPDTMSCGELQPCLEEMGARLLLRLLEQATLTGVPQQHSQATFAPKLSPDEEKIDWHRPAYRLHNQVRALSPAPGAWCLVRIGDGIKRLKILRSLPLSAPDALPGALLSCSAQAGWVVGCGEKSALRLLSVQLEGKRVLPADECLRGIQALIQQIL